LQLLENNANNRSHFDKLGNLSLKVYADGGIYVHNPMSNNVVIGENQMCGLVAVKIGQLKPTHTTVIHELDKNSANNIKFVGSEDQTFMTVFGKIASSIRNAFPKNSVGVRSTHSPKEARELLTSLSQAA
jgi:hypothetical protein